MSRLSGDADGCRRQRAAYAAGDSRRRSAATTIADARIRRFLRQALGVSAGH